MDYEDIRKLLLDTQTRFADLSVNLDEQTVSMPKANGSYRKVTRTVYRVRYDDDDDLIGNLHQKRGDSTWPQVRFHRRTQTWRPDRVHDRRKTWQDPKSVTRT